MHVVQEREIEVRKQLARDQVPIVRCLNRIHPIRVHSVPVELHDEPHTEDHRENHRNQAEERPEEERRRMNVTHEFALMPIRINEIVQAILRSNYRFRILIVLVVIRITCDDRDVR